MHMYFLFVDITSVIIFCVLQEKLSVIKSNQQICDYK